ncbi:hypothetical protein ACFPU0_25520 [Pseudomonas sp. GCM10022186]|uniref:hypothetical protein n=1 Tax=Pseudomonas sp. GCM10022186 TaxID=3252650 RepID=UPI00360B9E11
MDRIQKALVGGALGLIGIAVQAEPMCDCSKIIGRCAASIKMKSLTGAAPSYSANFSITSTTATCSKVSYYIDGTPYFNVLANTNSVEDSAFGTSPISMKSFSEVKCEVCAASAAAAGGGQSSPGQVAVDENTARFLGTWQGTLRWMLFSDDATIYIRSTGGHLTGRADMESGPVEFTSMRINGRTLVYTFIGQDGGNYTYTMNLTANGAAQVSGSSTSGPGISFKGTLRKVR